MGARFLESPGGWREARAFGAGPGESLKHRGRE